MKSCDEKMSRGLTVDDNRFSWKTSRPVHSVDNYTGFFTSRPLQGHGEAIVIPQVPRLMKKRMD